jgi:hypothetical protein
MEQSQFRVFDVIMLFDTSFPSGSHIYKPLSIMVDEVCLIVDPWVQKAGHLPHTGMTQGILSSHLSRFTAVYLAFDLECAA